MKYLCNPIVGRYRYQIIRNPMGNDLSVNREAADPSVIYYQGKYYLFASMTLSVWVSEDLVSWEEHRLPEELPLYGYAPDVCIRGNWIYFCTCTDQENGCIYYTENLLEGPYKKVELPFPVNDPNLFCDEDGRLYLYWGLSDETPIYGVELDVMNLQLVGEPNELIFSDTLWKGFERIGENHSLFPKTDEEVEQEMIERGIIKDQLPAETYKMICSFLKNCPYIEGAWMNRYQNQYYLQYAFAGTQYNIYGDGVYTSKSPLGPFELADNNPYSYSPGGFFPGAGHGSTFQDADENYWHAATMRISKNHNFERRVGIWPAGFDADGELFCNQRYGDWPMSRCEGKRDPWKKPEWMLLSYSKKASASSSKEGYEPKLALDENVQTWWTAGDEETPWLEVDLGTSHMVYAIQINFADDNENLKASIDGKTLCNGRYIEEMDAVTRWRLEGSLDGIKYKMIMDKSNEDTDFAHDLLVLKEGCELRYLRLTVFEIPYHQRVSISGLRVFGKGNGAAPAVPDFQISFDGHTDMRIAIKPDEAVGHVVLWGHRPDKLYHSCLTYGIEKNIGALVKDTVYYVRVDAFNENGITEGNCKRAYDKITYNKT